MPTHTLVNTETQPLGEWEIVRAAVAFANGDNLVIDSGSVQDAIEPEPVLVIEQPPTGNRSKRSLSKKPAPIAVQNLLQGVRETARGRIYDLLVDPQRIARFTLESYDPQLNLGQKRPVMALTFLKGSPLDTGLRVTDFYVLRSIAELCDLAVLLLLDVTKPYRRDLCVCKIESCARLFFVKKTDTGRQRRLYCCDEHVYEGRRTGTAARVKRYRSRKKEEKLARAMRRPK